MEEFFSISLKPSRMAVVLPVALTGLALIAMGLSGLSWALKGWSMLLLISVSVYYFHKSQQLRITAIGYGSQQLWLMRSQEKIAIELQDEQLVLSWLVVMQWREKERGKKGALALWPDSAHPEDLRRLRVLLRVGLVG